MNYISIGKQCIDKTCWVNVTNRTHINKPFGGMWACPINEEDGYISKWYKWCCNNKPSWVKNYGITFELTDENRVYIIDCYKDLEALYDKYYLCDGIFGDSMLNFELMKLDYDAILLTDAGEKETRSRFYKMNLYGWDVESLLVLNFDAIKNVKLIDLTKYI